MELKRILHLEEVVTYYYDNKDFTKKDVIDIAKDTTKEDDLFSYVGYKKTKNKDDFGLSL